MIELIKKAGGAVVDGAIEEAKTVAKIWAIWFALCLAGAIGLIWVLIHFIQKLW